MGEADQERRDAADRDQAWDLMERLGACLLVTVTPAGPRARPMRPIPRRAEGVIWFLTDAESHKAEELERSPDICLLFGDGAGLHLSVGGYATLTNDRDAVAALWSPEAELFWPEGPAAARVNAIHVEPVDAELWEGDKPAVAARKMAFAALRGMRPELGRHARLRL